MAVGGDIQEITYNHPTLGSGTIFPKAGEDSTFEIGGLRSADDDNNVDGGGNAINILTRRRWAVEVTAAWDDNIREDLEKLSALAASPEDSEITVTKASGAVYGGKGRPVGDISGSGQNATISIKFSGGGQLKKIS